MRNLEPMKGDTDNPEKLKALFIKKPIQVVKSLSDLILNDNYVDEEKKELLMAAVLLVEGNELEKIDIFEKYLTMHGEQNNQGTLKAVIGLSTIARQYTHQSNAIKEFLKTHRNKSLEEKFFRYYERPLDGDTK
jgi:hypothetical protein